MAKEKRTVAIHGKDYETVASRIERFRKEKELYGIETELLQNNETTVVVKAIIRDCERQGVIIATGHAEENRTSSQINRTSALENCETSAIGRALACFGYIGTEFASADEVAQAIHQQSEPAKTQPAQEQTKPTTQEPDKNKITEPQRKRLYAIGKNTGWKDEEMHKLIKDCGYEHSKDILRKDYDGICKLLENGVPDIPHEESNQDDLPQEIKDDSAKLVADSKSKEIKEVKAESGAPKIYKDGEEVG